MSVSQLIGKRCHVLVSDPWEFGTECGVGPFVAVVGSIQDDALLLLLEVPIEYRGTRLMTILARPRSVYFGVDSLISGSRLAANMALIPVLVNSFSEVTNEVKAGMVPVIGSLEIEKT